MRYKQGKAYTPEAYSNDADYFKDVAKAYGDELQVLYEAGLRNVQFDDPGLACEYLGTILRQESLTNYYLPFQTSARSSSETGGQMTRTTSVR